jgi:cardiolipin synthase
MLTWTTLYFASEWAIRLAMLVSVPQRRSPAAARAWLLFVFVLPWPGLLLYLTLGRPRLSHRRAERDEMVGEFLQAEGRVRLARYAAGPEIPPQYDQAAALAQNLGRSPIVSGNRVEFLADYDGSIERLVADMDAATRHVHLLYYIFADDRTGSRVIDALARAAARGVDCRVLVDAFGSKRWLSNVLRKLKGAEVDAAPVSPTGLLRRDRDRIDLRNHRKIAVIDGRVAYVGSQNVVDKDFKPGIVYAELVARVSGPVVLELQALFLADYVKETQKKPGGEGLFPETAPAGSTAAHVLPSGPGFFHENIQRYLVTLVHSARRRIVVSTPYFVPDQGVLQAMQTAVARGVEVRLIVSRKADQWLVGWAQRSYYQELLEAGVRIFEYRPGLLHAKYATFDDDLALVGSANLDIRSFQLNAEVVLTLYDSAAAAELRDVQLKHLADCTELTQERWSQRPFRQRFMQNLARLVDSVL